MNVDLQLTSLDTDPASPNYSGDAYVRLLQDSQGNILKSHGRDVGAHLFLQFVPTNIAGARHWLATTLAPQLTSGWAQLQQTRQFRATGTSAVFVTAALSADGYRALGFSDAQLPSDPSFLRGAKHPDPHAGLGLNDPPVSSWQSGFQQPLHLLLMVADDDQAVVDSTAAALLASLSGIATLVDSEPGAAFHNARGQVIEHFGFTDGVSQPLFLAADLEKARMNGGLDVYDPSAPLGLALNKDPLGTDSGFGSYLVFRKLAQDVAGFRGQEAQLAQALGLDAGNAELAGAYVVGRFRDGTPVVQQPLPGWTNEPNNFDFDADADGMRCPFQAHIRKTNPRGDKLREFGLTPGEDRMRRIARRGVSFGPLDLAPPSGAEVGLLFMSVQNSIVDQFEFIQAIWSNFTQFLRPGTGLDPVTGQGVPGVVQQPQPWPKTWGVRRDGSVAFDFSTWVQMRGGEYFYLPSIGFFRSL